jgi:hypothetical protein
MVSIAFNDGGSEGAYSFLDLTELLELVAEGLLVSVPCEATEAQLVCQICLGGECLRKGELTQ